RYLDQVEIGEGADSELYAFDYYQKLAYNTSLRGSDAWGYRNGSTGNGSTGVSVPWQNVDANTFYSEYGDPYCSTGAEDLGFSIGQGSKNPDLSCRYGVLKKIIYPGGGSTEFSYQLNQYRNGVGNVVDAGGLRIAKIAYFDGSNPASAFEKTYKYGENEDGAGILKYEPELLDDYYYEQQVQYVSINVLHEITATGF